MSRASRLFVGTALVALAGAMVLRLLIAAGQNTLWGVTVHLTLFGWISGFIVAINYHVMPVFIGRQFVHPQALIAHWAVFTLGLALATLGRLGSWSALAVLGLSLEWLASLIFAVNIVGMLRQPRTRPRMPTSPQQAGVDRLATLAALGFGVIATLCVRRYGMPKGLIQVR